MMHLNLEAMFETGIVQTVLMVKRKIAFGCLVFLL